jgi:hypothetical protein
VAKWELMHEVVKNLGRGWQVDASGLQDLGFFAGAASGPDGMELRFVAPTEKLDPRREHSYPPLGWLRVDGRLHFRDKALSANLSIMLRESLTAEELANELIARFLPFYADVLRAVEKDNSQHPEVGLR